MNGRALRIQKGVAPDVRTIREPTPYIVKSLNIYQVFTDYALKYIHEHKDIAAPESFHLTEEEFEEFINFAVGKKYKSSFQSYLELTKKSYNLQSFPTEEMKNQFEAMVSDMFSKENKLHVLRKNKIHLKARAEEKIIFLKYGIQKYHSYCARNNNVNTSKAIEILSDMEQYKEILNPQEIVD